jgi:hypothetical protein
MHWSRAFVAALERRANTGSSIEHSNKSRDGRACLCAAEPGWAALARAAGKPAGRPEEGEYTKAD